MFPCKFNNTFPKNFVIDKLQNKYEFSRNEKASHFLTRLKYSNNYISFQK